MLPYPLHPAVVHFPVVLALLLPLAVVGALWAIRRGVNARRAWMFPFAGAAAVALSAWVAVQTGGAQSEKVERIVSEQQIESHEEMAEAFLVTAAGVTILAAAGLVGGMTGRAARVLTGVGALALAGLVARVGHSGGQLVYRYGAASAYTQQSGGPAVGPGSERESRHGEGRPGDRSGEH